MISERMFSGLKLTASALALWLAASPLASAQTVPAPSSNTTINLIRLLVKQHVITQKAANALLKEAEAEAAQASAGQAASAAPINTAQNSAPASSASAPPPPAPGVVRVPYVPDIVKKQIREEVKKEVIQQARDENWAQPEAVPAWTKRIRLHGDFRFREETDLYSNSNADDLIDFASFNANGPTEINSNLQPIAIPFLNTRSNRYGRLSIRARLGLDADVTDGVAVGLQLASGGDGGPVSTTQLLGGGFGKKDIWLDQAFITLKPVDYASVTAGRMPNPFFHTDLMWDPDLNFDGAMVAGQTDSPWIKDFHIFGSGGFFPIGYVGSNYPNNCGPIQNVACGKASEYQKWLLGGQVGFDWKLGDFDWKFGLADYDFHNLQGALSTPCFIYLGFQECSTDQTRPPFMQKGNTLFLIREIVPDPTNPNQSPEPQFVGLSFKYNVVNVTQELSYPIDDSHAITLGVDYVRNINYDPNYACRYAPLGLPVTNVLPGAGSYIDPCDPPTKPGLSKATIQSGPNGFYGNLTYGTQDTKTEGAWKVWLGYKYIQPDAVPDGFTDSDFHLGGTNAKGFIIGGSLGIYKDTWVTARWLSANEVSGPPLSIDVLQFDLNTGF